MLWKDLRQSRNTQIGWPGIEWNGMTNEINTEETAVAVEAAIATTKTVTEDYDEFAYKMKSKVALRISLCGGWWVSGMT